jgi:hypothetical protein
MFSLLRGLSSDGGVVGLVFLALGDISLILSVEDILLTGV